MPLKAKAEEHQLHSRRNRPTSTSRSQALTAYARGLVDDMSAKRQRRFTEEQRDECTANMLSLLTDLLAASEADPGLWIGYSRGRKEFIKGGAYWNNKTGRSLPSQTYYLASIDHLAQQGLIRNEKAKPGFGKFSSRIKPTEDLTKRFSELDVNWANISTRLDSTRAAA